MILVVPSVQFLPATQNVEQEKPFVEFKVVIGQLLHHAPHSSKQFSAFKARLNDLVHTYCGAQVDIGDYLNLKECIQTIKSLQHNNNIHITKPEKGSEVVILNKNKYISKMNSLLQDTSKFETLGPFTDFYNTAKIEAQIQRRLLQIKKDASLRSETYHKIRPTVS